MLKLSCLFVLVKKSFLLYHLSCVVDKEASLTHKHKLELKYNTVIR